MSVMAIFWLLYGIELAMTIYLKVINAGEVKRNAHAVPSQFKEVMDDETYKKSVSYFFANYKLSWINTVFGVGLLVIVLASGVLPYLYNLVIGYCGDGVFSQSLYLVLLTILTQVLSLPISYYDTFVLEEKFGFNKTTHATFFADIVKGWVVTAAIMLPLFSLIFSLINFLGTYWWVYASAVVIIFELLMYIVYPIAIQPLFNKVEPLPEGECRDRLFKLADRLGFSCQNIFVIDGSRRSKHSNAYFTGFGRWRSIVLYDTLIEQHTQEELESVLAHEIGHYKRGHILKGIISSAITMILMFGGIAWVASNPWIYADWGFKYVGLAPAFVIFSLMSGPILFWLNPLSNHISRKHEYEADSFEREAMGGPEVPIRALRKLYKDNLTNLTPHPLYSSWYYSHPTPYERERAFLEGHPMVKNKNGTKVSSEALKMTEPLSGDTSSTTMSANGRLTSGTISQFPKKS